MDFRPISPRERNQFPGEGNFDPLSCLFSAKDSRECHVFPSRDVGWSHIRLFLFDLPPSIHCHLPVRLTHPVSSSGRVLDAVQDADQGSPGEGGVQGARVKACVRCGERGRQGVGEGAGRKATGCGDVYRRARDEACRLGGLRLEAYADEESGPEIGF